MTTASLREDLIFSHMPQVELLARRLHRRCPQVELDDLISAGTIGLIQAVDRVDPSWNLKLKTLAEHRNQWSLARLPATHRSAPEKRFQKQRDAVIEQLSAAGEVPGDSGTAQTPRCFAKEVCNAVAHDHGVGADLDSRIRRRL
jgi:RNA polymerase sigma factor FliA